MSSKFLINQRRRRCLLFAAVFAWSCTHLTAQTTTITLTDSVLTANVMRLGMHTAGHTYYDSPIKKNIVEDNFEGTVYRSIFYVDRQEGTVVYGPGNNKPATNEVLISLFKQATYWVLSGPDIWQTGQVVDATVSADETALTLDKTFSMHPKKNGLLIEVNRRSEGFTGIKLKDLTQIGTVNAYNGVTSTGCSFATGDVRSDGYGQVTLKMSGSASYQVPGIWSSGGSTDNTYKVSLWAKASSGTPSMSIGLSPGRLEPIALTSDWALYEKTFTVSPARSKVDIKMISSGGDVLVDDLVASVEGESNPTVYRDAYVAALKDFNPGVMRMLNNGGHTLENLVSPVMEGFATSAAPTYWGKSTIRTGGMHGFYKLCEYVGSAAWATLPGTMKLEEVDQFMEYIGAPASVGWGQRRAKWGHSRPWTETLKEIYVQFGNEAITFFGTGYFGPDYWKALIARAKKSPYYQSNIKFVIDQQGFGPNTNLRYHDNADILCVNNYSIYGLCNNELGVLDTRKELFEYVFSYPYYKWEIGGKGVDFLRTMHYHDVELAIYEGNNFHMTHGDAPSEPRNQIVAGIGGQLSMVNSALKLQRDHGIRAQNQFNFSGYSFTGSGSFGDGIEVKLWGQVISPLDLAKRRFRPGYLLSKACNRVISGDHILTTLSGDTPTFSSYGYYDDRVGRKCENFELDTLGPFPLLEAYGYEDGTMRSLILTNLSTSEARTVAVNFEGTVWEGKATQYLVTADSITANNEPGHAEQVAIAESTISGFASGSQVTVPAFSLLALKWFVGKPTGTITDDRAGRASARGVRLTRDALVLSGGSHVSRLQVSLYEANGRRVHHSMVDCGATARIALPRLSPAAYLLMIKAGETTKVQRMTIVD